MFCEQRWGWGDRTDEFRGGGTVGGLNFTVSPFHFLDAAEREVFADKNGTFSEHCSSTN